MNYKIDIHKDLCNEFVYEVDIIVEANKIKSYFRTSFNNKQPEVAIRRAIKNLKIPEHQIKQITIIPVQKLGKSQIK